MSKSECMVGLSAIRLDDRAAPFANFAVLADETRKSRYLTTDYEEVERQFARRGVAKNLFFQIAPSRLWAFAINSSSTGEGKNSAAQSTERPVTRQLTMTDPCTETSRYCCFRPCQFAQKNSAATRVSKRIKGQKWGSGGQLMVLAYLRTHAAMPLTDISSARLLRGGHVSQTQNSGHSIWPSLSKYTLDKTFYYATLGIGFG